MLSWHPIRHKWYGAFGMLSPAPGSRFVSERAVVGCITVVCCASQRAGPRLLLATPIEPHSISATRGFVSARRVNEIMDQSKPHPTTQCVTKTRPSSAPWRAGRGQTKGTGGEASSNLSGTKLLARVPPPPGPPAERNVHSCPASRHAPCLERVCLEKGPPSGAKPARCEQGACSMQAAARIDPAQFSISSSTN